MSPASSKNVTAKHIRKHFLHLTETIGERLLGTPGEHAAARYIRSMFRSYGLRTTVQEYPVVTFSNRKCKLEILQSGKWRAVPAMPVMLSASTPQKGVEGEVYFPPSNEPEFFSGRVSGKIVFLQGRINTPDRRALLAHGPKAVVMVENRVDAEPVRSNEKDALRHEQPGLPMIRIGHLDGVAIAGGGQARARLTLLNSEKASCSRNIIAEKPGDELPGEMMVACAHYDSHFGTVGALDNASGTAVLLELARATALLPTRRTIRFVAFGAEEPGLVGSRYYAEDLLAKAARERKRKGFHEGRDRTILESHLLALNMDAMGAVLGGHCCKYCGSSDIGRAMVMLAKELGIPCDASPGPASSDGTPLAAVGIPTIQVGKMGGVTAYQHSSRDEPGLVSAESLEESARLMQAFIRRYASESVMFPFPRDIPGDQAHEISEYFRKAGYPAPGQNG